MKKQIAILATILAAGGLSALGQGYVNFTSSPHDVYDAFTSGTATYAPGDVEATFLWSSTGANDLLSAGIPTTGGSVTSGWSDIATMIASGTWSVANNATTAAEADVADHASGVTIGGIGYGSFDLNMGSVAAGSTITMVVVGWDNLTGGTTLESAEAANAALGWSSAFSYTTGASSSTPVDTLNTAGFTAFGVSPTPEPTTLALAGLGGLSMLFLRRRKA